MKVIAARIFDLKWLRSGSFTRATKTGARVGVVLCAIISIFIWGVPTGFAEESSDTGRGLENQTAAQSETPQEGKKSPGDLQGEHSLDEIVVTATRTAKSIADAPASVSVVTHENIENRNVQTVDSALNLVPGLFNKRSKDLDTTAWVILHGIPNQKRTLVLLDGLPINGGYSGDVSWNGLDPDNVDRIEVAKGPFSSLYGGNAMGGVVNILTRMPEKREVVIKSEGGSNNFWTTYGSYGDKLTDRLSIFASYGYKTGDGYPTQPVVKTPTTMGAGTSVSGAIPTTTVKGATAFEVGDTGDNNFSRDSADFKLEYKLTDSSKAMVSFMRNNYVYGYGAPSSYLTDSSGSSVFSGSVLVNNNQNRLALTEYNYLSGGGFRTENIGNVAYETKLFGDALLKINCGVLNRERDGYVSPSSTATRSGGTGTYRDTPSDTVNTDLQMILPIFEKHLLTFGLTYKYDQANTTERVLSDWTDNGTKGDLKYESKGKDDVFSFYTQAEINILKNLTGYIGVRGDYWRTYDGYVNMIGSTGYPQDLSGTSEFSANPKGALVFRPNNSTTLRAEVGTAFRPPNVYELYATWKSGSTTYACNPELTPETSFSWDFGLDQKLGDKTTFRTTFFYNELYDMIYYKTITTNYKQYINAGEARTYGLELELERKVFDCLTLFGNFTVTESEMLSNPASPSSEGKQLTGVPTFQYTLGGEFKRGPLSIIATGRYASKVYNNDDNSDTASGVYQSYDSYFVADISAKYQVAKYASLTFSINNLLDANYFTYYQAPGRQFYGGVTLKF